jgi:succinoglycan biosynthesis transport protein ExoP
LPARLRNRNPAHKNYYNPESFEKPLVAEAFHQLRTSLLFSTAGGSPQTVLVTSGQPAEGKTVTSLNLAKSLAQLGHKVLLIDADMRCPKMHLLKNLSNAKGLSNLLTTKELNHLFIKDTIQHDIEKDLDLLTSGPQAPNPTNLLSSNVMRTLLEHLTASYTHIVIDSPPVLYFADSVILSTNVNAVVLIARNNYSTHEMVIRAKRKLLDVRANIVGLVLNDIILSDYQYNTYNYYNQLEPTESENGSSILNLSE